MTKSLKSIALRREGQIAILKSIREIRGFTEGNKVAILTYEDRVKLSL